MFIKNEDYKERIDNSNNLLNIIDRFKKDSALDTTPGRDNSSTTVPISDKGDSEEVGNETSDNEIHKFLDAGQRVNSPVARKVGRKGKVTGDKNVPEVIKDIVTIQSNFAKGTELRKTWGISNAEISNLKHGIPNRSNPDSPANERAKVVIESHVAKIRGVVEERILSTLACMTDDKLVDIDAKALSYVARNLASILPPVEKQAEVGNRNVNFQTIYYAPQQREVESYEVIDVVK